MPVSWSAWRLGKRAHPTPRSAHTVDPLLGRRRRRAETEGRCFAPQKIMSQYRPLLFTECLMFWIPQPHSHLTVPYFCWHVRLWQLCNPSFTLPFQVAAGASSLSSQNPLATIYLQDTKQNAKSQKVRTVKASRSEKSQKVKKVKKVKETKARSQRDFSTFRDFLTFRLF